MWCYNYTPQNYICHHGIKGQRWGIRRFQREDGSLTSRGKKRYDSDPSNGSPKKSDKEKSLYRLKLEKKYREKKGLSKEEAEQRADRRIKIQKFAAGAAVVAITAAAAYCAYKGYQNYTTDKVLSKDTVFNRVMAANGPIKMRDGRIYATYDKADNTKYKGILARQLKSRGQILGTNADIYNLTMNFDEDIKIASPKRAKDTFNELFNNDSEFRSNAVEAIREMRFEFGGYSPDLMRSYKAFANDVMQGKKLEANGYDVFNVALANNSPTGQKAANKFYDSLKKQGINAIEDLNDRKYSGYNTKTPLIIFGGNKYNWTAEPLSDSRIRSNLNKAYTEIATETVVEGGKRFAGMTLGAGAGAVGIVKLGIARAQKVQIEKYKKEHPNTKMNDLEILESLQAKAKSGRG